MDIFKLNNMDTSDECPIIKSIEELKGGYDEPEPSAFYGGCELVFSEMKYYITMKKIEKSRADASNVKNTIIPSDGHELYKQLYALLHPIDKYLASTIDCLTAYSLDNISVFTNCTIPELNMSDDLYESVDRILQYASKLKINDKQPGVVIPEVPKITINPIETFEDEIKLANEVKKLEDYHREVVNELGKILDFCS